MRSYRFLRSWRSRESLMPMITLRKGKGRILPFSAFRCPNSDNFAADGTVYFPITEIDIELYTDKKDPEIEKRLEDQLIQSGIFFEKTETWIDSEKLYEVLYSFEQEA
jgi:hypothetical protein